MRIIGHRGARGEAPENTLGGFQYIQDLGIRGVEFDVRQLKDHALIVMHDDQMLRTTGQEKQLYECDATDLAQYNHAVTWSTWNQFEPTPLLQQTLKVIYNFDHIEVEVKAVASEQHAFQLKPYNSNCAVLNKAQSLPVLTLKFILLYNNKIQILNAVY